MQFQHITLTCSIFRNRHITTKSQGRVTYQTLRVVSKVMLVNGCTIHEVSLRSMLHMQEPLAQVEHFYHQAVLANISTGK